MMEKYPKPEEVEREVYETQDPNEVDEFLQIGTDENDWHRRSVRKDEWIREQTGLESAVVEGHSLTAMRMPLRLRVRYAYIPDRE